MYYVAVIIDFKNIFVTIVAASKKKNNHHVYSCFYILMRYKNESETEIFLALLNFIIQKLSDLKRNYK
ncbi:hypothetical protein BpHYR1_012636 [Brachionus plicatilis]|uniref:MULE transposase domain-containing protein n=1 Tax=Brachionus plicatilis TaxID=10195 RepID=A0A3M7SUQ9_BRAPC|nr:hypothetical protein BpHYR1_012636 [Brachionus plicatilis]